MLRSDLDAPKKQRHTPRRILARLVDEHGAEGLSYSTVRDRSRRRQALTKLINRYGRVDALLVDELGYLQLDRRGAELLFQVLTEREERSAIAIASNEPFSCWTKTFTDP